jgi:hypothetical protein
MSPKGRPATPAALDPERFESVRSEWLSVTRMEPSTLARFQEVKREAEALVDAGQWTSGPEDMLRVIRRQRDELIHSRIIAWLLVPTNRHRLGRSFLTGLLDHMWPGENLMRSGPVVVDLEVTASGLDAAGRLRAATADIVIRGESATVVIENKVGAAEQPEQCERLYWAFASEPGDTRWVFLTPSGRVPMTATSDPAVRAWRCLSYPVLLEIYGAAIDAANRNESIGRATALQYRATLEGAYRS